METTDTFFMTQVETSTQHLTSISRARTMLIVQTDLAAGMPTDG